MSTFDPTQILETETTDALDTQIIQVPEGEWTGQVREIRTKPFTNKQGEQGLILNVVWDILDDEVKKQTNRDNPTCTQTVFLDLTFDNAGNPSGLDMSPGKNVNLGRLRKALGQNKSGKKWKPADMQGQMATVYVGHRQFQRDADSEPETQAEVRRVSPMK